MNFIAMNTNDIGNLTLNKIKLKAAGCLLVLLLFSSCRTHKMNYDFRELAEAAVKLEMDIDMKDNHALYVESSKWIALPTVMAAPRKRESTALVSQRQSIRRYIMRNSGEVPKNRG